MYYYGVIVCLFTGELTNIEGEHDYKPETESCGMSLCHWRKSEKERDETIEYNKNYIKNYRKTHYKNLETNCNNQRDKWV